MSKRILCPTDFSTTAQGALDYAARLATQLDSELVVAHAFSRPASWDREGQRHPASDHVQRDMDAVVCDVPFASVMHAGPPGPVICWLAQEHDCDLIVMGTHGRTGLKHLLVGSTAEYVLQHAQVPTLTIRDRPKGEPKIEEPIVLPIPGPGA